MSKELDNMTEQEMLNTIKLDSLQSIIEQEGDRDIISPCCITAEDVTDMHSVMVKVRAAAWEYFKENISYTFDWDCDKHLDEDDMGKDFDQLTEIINDHFGFAEEFTCTATAMEYLAKEDPTLTAALEEADDYGYAPRDLDSCKLASLLGERKNKEQWNGRELQINELAEVVNKISAGVRKYFGK